MSAAFRSGLVTLLGRPNVGKSTLLNRLVGEHVSITARRPQTTRHRILGIRNLAQAQIVYVDTPGLHPETERPLNRYLNRVARASLEGVDAIVLLIDAGGWHDGDLYPLAQARAAGVPVILAINKIDRLKDRDRLLPLIAESRARMEFAAIVPVSARDGDNLEALEREVLARLPAQAPIYPPDRVTDRSERFLAAELVREQIFRRYGAEVPYATAVSIERFKRVKGALEIDATVWVERPGQRVILIGRGGEGLKTVGTEARRAMQQRFGTKVRLALWVKVREHWSQSERALQALGYREEG
jgi:GTP-binding protein Era